MIFLGNMVFIQTRFTEVRSSKFLSIFILVQVVKVQLFKIRIQPARLLLPFSISLQSIFTHSFSTDTQLKMSTTSHQISSVYSTSTRSFYLVL